ncbi:hypothetical protein PIB30_026883 [Stylosanthes scabra]|uniref:Zinc finger GRF-type domain-containing protein n=1 Tax=Stylosanthes scabra TaxID=79078 RepID=A0ABU6U9Y4_9FABA|nr:hypothetical protein [Stylosanthes scabra]
MLKMSGEARESSSHRVDRCHGGESLSVNIGSGVSSIRAVLKKKKKFVAPMCSCGAYAILFESSTPNNPNRLFFGYQYLKNRGSHCKFFAWLDDYVTCLNEGVVINTASVIDPMIRIEGRIESMEMKIKMMESEHEKGKKNRRGHQHESSCVVFVRDNLCLFLGCIVEVMEMRCFELYVWV